MLASMENTIHNSPVGKLINNLVNKTNVKLTRPCVCQCVGPTLCNLYLWFSRCELLVTI